MTAPVRADVAKKKVPFFLSRFFLALVQGRPALGLSSFVFLEIGAVVPLNNSQHYYKRGWESFVASGNQREHAMIDGNSRRKT